MNPRGFTLVEVLIVILIIGMLSMGAIAGYGSYRRSAVLSLTGDLIVAQLKQMQAAAAHGRGDGVRFRELSESLASGEVPDDQKVDAFCYGMRFQAALEGFTAVKVRWVFKNNKKWEEGQWQYIGCDDDSEDIAKVEKDARVVIEKIEVVKDSIEYEVTQLLEFRYTPPDAALMVTADMTPDSYEKVIFYLRYGTSESESARRTIELSL